MPIFDDTRKDWNARPPTSARTVVAWSKRLGVSWHWIGPGKGPSKGGPHSACLSKVLAWQRMHQANNGWKDIGYNALVCQHARAIEGRGLEFSGSHSPGVNTSHVGVQFMRGEGDGPPGADEIARAQRLRADIGALGANIRRDWPHKDDLAASTACPGPWISTAARSGLFTKAPPTAPRTALRPGDRGDDVKALQVLLIAAGADIVADGSYGPATEAAVRAFQTTSGLDVDGIAGPATRTALKAPTPTPPAPTQEVTAVFMVKRKDADPVFKSDGFRRVHIDKVQRDALLSAGVKLHDHFTTDAQLDAFGPVVTIAPGVTS